MEEANANGENKALTEEKLEVKVVDASSVQKKEKESDAFQGLTKEELMMYASDPSWVRIRWFLFILFWIIWTGMLAAAVVIIVLAPKCPSPDPKEWWQKGPVYTADLSTFKDGNPTTFKDFEAELDYLVDTGVPAIYLPNILKGPGLVSGEYGVSDYRDVKQELGSLADWTSLVEATKARDIKVIVDMLPLYTSEQHAWFELFTAGTEKQDFYSGAKTGAAGNPLLKLDNPAVVTELQAVVQFWLDKGVDGFNLVGYEGLQPAVGDANYNLVLKLRELTDKAGEEQGSDKILVCLGEKGTGLGALLPLYGGAVNENHEGELFHLVAAQPASFNEAGAASTAGGILAFVTQLNNTKPSNAWTLLSLSSIDLYEEYPDAVAMLGSLLPATPVIKAGNELGMSGGMLDTAMQKNQTTADSEGASSHYGVYRALAGLRHQKTVLFGSIEVAEIDGCVVLSRVKKGNPGYVFVFNMQSADQTLDLSAKVPNIADNIRIMVSSLASEDQYRKPDPEAVKTFPADAVELKAGQAVIFTFVPQF